MMTLSGSITNSLPFPTTIELSDLKGGIGFKLYGESASDSFGSSIASLGDVNDDGLDDCIIGAQAEGAIGRDAAGKAYVLFGSRAWSQQIAFDVNDLNGSNGFKIYGENQGDRLGLRVASAGDVNADGIPDIFIGADNADPLSRDKAGVSYVLFGGKNIGQSGIVDLRLLDPSGGVKILGASSGDNSGYSLSSAGDFNGDGVDDLIIGARDASPSGKSDAGMAYILFGHAKIGNDSPIDLASLTQQQGFSLIGQASRDRTGFSVSTAGDVNGDGISDVIIGAHDADPFGRSEAGRIYVLFGSNSIQFQKSIALSTLTGNAGFFIAGATSDDQCGFFVKGGGDVNRDGFDDLLIGCPSANPSGISKGGQTYVIFGKANIGVGGNIDLSKLNPSMGIIINGIHLNSESGKAVELLNDINNDGINDILIGARNSAPGNKADAGITYVVFGSPTLSTMSLSEIDGTNGLKFFGENQNDQSGWSVSSAGDINGDGIDDLLLSAREATALGRSLAGKAYALFGRGTLTMTLKSKQVTSRTTNRKTTLQRIDPKTSITSSSVTTFNSLTDMISRINRTHTVNQTSRSWVQNTFLRHSESFSNIAHPNTSIQSILDLSPPSPNALVPAIVGSIVSICLCLSCVSSVFFFLRKKESTSTDTPPVEQQEAPVSDKNHIYDLLPSSRPPGHYKAPDLDVKPSIPQDYCQVRLSQLNREMSSVQEEYVANIHQGYDDLTKVVKPIDQTYYEEL